jgi:hypothetical protein
MSNDTLLLVASTTASIGLLIVTSLYTIHTSKMVKDARNKALQDGFLKEMDSIVGPLKSRIGKYQYYEPIYITPEYEKAASEFSENIKKNKYLVPKDLRVLIDNYFIALEMHEVELRKIRYELKQLPLSEYVMPYIGPAPVNEGNGSYLENIRSYIRALDPNSDPNRDFTNKLTYFHDIVQEGHTFEGKYSIKNARFDLEEAVKIRYTDLEDIIESLRIELDKNKNRRFWEFWK